MFICFVSILFLYNIFCVFRCVSHAKLWLTRSHRRWLAVLCLLIVFFFLANSTKRTTTKHLQDRKIEYNEKFSIEFCSFIVYLCTSPVTYITQLSIAQKVLCVSSLCEFGVHAVAFSKTMLIDWLRTDRTV